MCWPLRLSFFDGSPRERLVCRTVYFLAIQVSAAKGAATGPATSSFSELLNDDDAFNDAFAHEQMARAGAGGARGELVPCPGASPTATFAQRRVMGGTNMQTSARPGSPTFNRGPEFIMLRVLQGRDGSAKIEGMAKGDNVGAPAQFIEKDSYPGIVLRGRPG